jgi:NADH-ubiquinone oxidoreductase chain 2
MDKKNSPIQLINQIKGYFYINPLLSICLATTIFSFIGIPPLIGFFGKQMILSASLDKGFYFLVLIAISTSVIGAGYYLNLIKEIFFYHSEYKESTFLKNKLEQFRFIIQSNMKSLYIINSSTFTLTVSSTTLITILFIFFNKE